MAETTYSKQSSWENRFEEPTLDQMLADLSDDQRVWVDLVRDKMETLAEVSEAVTWQGLPWRWAVTYSTPFDDGRPLAFLVLNPKAPELALTLTTEMVERLPMKRLKKHVRDGILLGKQVAGVYWASWELANKTQVQDLLDVVSRKYKLLVADAAAAESKD